MNNKHDEVNEKNFEETIHDVKEAIKEDPLIVDSVLSNEESLTSVVDQDDIVKDISVSNPMKIYISEFITYIGSAIRSPFLALTKVNEKQFSFALGIFIFSLLLTTSVIFIYLSEFLYATNAFIFGNQLSLFSLAQTFFTLLLSMGILQFLFFLLFFFLIRIQRGRTTFKLAFTRYMHISITSMGGYVLTFLLALLSFNMALSLLLLFSLLQMVLVSFLFFIEKREQKQLIDPIYNSLLYIIGVSFILSFVGAEIFSRYAYFW